MKLKRARCRAFRSFYDEQETPELPEKGLFLIDGFNKNSGGGSNSGKSNLTLMIAYALDFCPYPATILQNWDSAQKMQNVVELMTKDGPLVLSRGEHPYVEFKGVKTTGAKAYTEKLQEIFKLSPDMLEALTYRRQRNQDGTFLSMDDSRKKSFLSELLGLDKVEKIVEQSKLEIVELEKLLLINEELLRNTPELPVPNLEMPVDNTAELEGDLKTTQWAQVQVKIKQTALEKEIEELKRKINKAQGVLTWFLKDLETDRTNSVELQAALKKLKDLDDPSKVQVLDQSMKLAYKELVSFKESLRGTDNERSIKFLQESLKDMEKEISRIPQLLNELDKVNQNLNSLHDEKCFVCDGPRVRNPEVVRQVEAQKAALEGRVEALESSRAHFPVRSGQLEAQIQAYRDADKANQNQGARLEELCNKYRRDLTDYEASIAKNKQMVALEIKNIESQIALARNEASGVYKTQVDSLKGKLHTLELNRMDLVNKYREHTSKISSIENDIKLNKLIETQARTEYNIRLREYQKNQNHRNQWIDNINKFRTRANLEKDLCDALGREGFLGSIFEEVLMDISQRTNEYLKQIPNVATLTISLDTEKETKSGKISRKITPVVYKSGKAVPLTGGISGGMLAVVALAVDLALLSIIQERTGFELGWLILDEAMDGLGSIEKEACFELLRQVAHNKLILVIDHDDKAKAFCDGSIRVTTENDRSEISPTIT